VFELAREHGLVLLETGRLIDTARGETVPEHAQPMAPTTAAQAAAMRRLSASEAEANIVRNTDYVALPDGPLTGGGVREAAIIGRANAAEGAGAGRIDWPHGFHLRRLTFAPGGAVARHRRAEPEVLFVSEGRVEVRWDGHALELFEGDTLTIPVGLIRGFFSETKATAFVVRGGDAPAAPDWVPAGEGQSL
jgi:mannose-6-phosphate isomerase-like protein (cupin superfamily)